MKKTLNLAVAVASALAITSTAQAAFELGEDNPGSTYAQELNYDSENGGGFIDANDTAGAGAAGLVADNTVTTPIGFGVLSGTKVYVRFDLANATFDAIGPAAGELGVGPGGVPVAGHTVAIVDGGADTEACVVFEVEADTAGPTDISQTDDVVWGLPDLNILDNSAPIEATYNLFTTAADAACFKPAPVAPGLTASVTGEILSMGSSVDFTVTKTNDTTAQVADLYRDTNEANTGDSLLVHLGTVEVDAVAGVLEADGSDVDEADLIGTAADLSVVGDFTAAKLDDPSSVDLSAAVASPGACSGAAGPVADLTDPQNAVFEDLAWGTTYDLCYQVLDDDADGEADNPIAASEYEVTIALDPAAGATLGSIGSEKANEIVRDGAVLRIPYFSSHANSNYVSLANMGSTDALYTTTCYSKVAGNDPITGLLEQPIAAQRTKNLFFSRMCPGFKPNFYDAIEITVTTPQGNIVGTLVRVNTTTGEANYSYISNNEHGE